MLMPAPAVTTLNFNPLQAIRVDAGPMPYSDPVRVRVLAGAAGITQPGLYRDHHLIRIATPHVINGELPEASLLTSCEVHALTPTTIEITRVPPAQAFEVLTQAYEQMAERRRDVEILTCMQRLAEILYVVGKANNNTIPLTQSYLGDMAGTTREHASKIITDWVRDGLLTSSYRRLDVLQPDALYKIAFDLPAE